MGTIDFKALVDNSIDVIVRCGLDGIATYVSPSVTRLLGITPDELIGRSHMFFVLPEDVPVLVKTVAMHRAGQSDGLATFRMVRKDGATIWVEGRGRLVEAVGRAAFFVIVLRDISDRKALEDRLAPFIHSGGLVAPDGSRPKRQSRETAPADRHGPRASPARPVRMVN